MRIINPSIELLEQTDLISHVARCARICYRKETGNDKALYDSLIKRNHLSMFRHATRYYIVPKQCVPKWVDDYMNAVTFNAKIVGIDIDYSLGIYYIVVNGQWRLEHPGLISLIDKYIVDAKEFANANETSWNMMRYTFKVITQISTSRELNRVSPNNIAEQSTRYVYEDGTICRPYWMTDEDYEIFKDEHSDDTFIPEYYLNNNYKIKVRKYVWSCDRSFFDYKDLIKFGMDRQDARGVLPLDTATVCAYTYSANEWRNIIDLRYYGITGKPHPNAAIIAGMIRKELMELGYEFR